MIDWSIQFFSYLQHNKYSSDPRTITMFSTLRYFLRYLVSNFTLLLWNIQWLVIRVLLSGSYYNRQGAKSYFYYQWFSLNKVLSVRENLVYINPAWAKNLDLPVLITDSYCRKANWRAIREICWSRHIILKILCDISDQRL